MKFPRFAPLTGAIFVVLLVIGFIPLGGNTPDTDASAAKIISFYNDHQTKEILAIVVVSWRRCSWLFSQSRSATT